jgi:hypothetical protein
MISFSRPLKMIFFPFGYKMEEPKLEAFTTPSNKGCLA